MSFLGGKYQPAEQVIDGTVQTFRGKQLGTGRPVFLHRIANPLSQENASLLKLLLTFLYSSSAAKDQVLDFGQEGDVCYAVTQNLPQCLLLREWLQFELDRCGELPGTASGRRAGAGDQAPYEVVPQRKPGVQTHSAPLEEINARMAEPAAPAPRGSEFTRVFYGDSIPAGNPPQAAPVRTVTPVLPELKPMEEAAAASSVARPETKTPDTAPGRHAGGEFAKLFENPEPSEPAAGGGTQTPDTAPGEFTKFFENSGMHVQRQRQSEMPPAVQRPAHAGTPLPPPAKGMGQGEFTRFFSSSPADAAPVSPRLEALNANPVDFQQMAKPKEPSAPGEFTRMFSAADPAEAVTSGEPRGGGEYTGLFGKPTATPTAPARGSEAFGSILESARTPATAAPPVEKAPPAMSGPSEFTRVVQSPANNTLDVAAPVLPAKVERNAPQPAILGVGSEAAANARSKKPLILVLLAILGVAVLFVLYITLRS